LILLRVALAVFFMAHAIVRVATGTIPQFGAFLSAQGLPFGVALVWCITVYELSAGMTMALGRAVRVCVAGFLVIVIGGIVLIHAARGWFVGEHGVGGMEYSLCLLVGLLAVAAADREQPR
jgi:putative oxidoreductase